MRIGKQNKKIFILFV